MCPDHHGLGHGMSRQVIVIVLIIMIIMIVTVIVLVIVNIGMVTIIIVVVRPVHLLRGSLLRVLESNSPGEPLSKFMDM